MKNLVFCITAVTVFLWAQPAFAYIDPGSGSAIVSAVIGFFVAVGLAVKTYWYKIKSIFSSSTKDSEKDSDS